MRRGAIMRLILEGIEEATPLWDKIYRDAAGAQNTRPKHNEQFFSSFVGHRLHKQSVRDDGFCTHETSHFVLEAAVVLAKQLHINSKIEKRYDLVLWRNREKFPIPYAIIEMKLDYRFHSILKDAEKVCTALQLLGSTSGGTLRNAYLAFPANDRSTIAAIDGVEESVGKIDDYLHGKPIQTQSKICQIEPLLKKAKTLNIPRLRREKNEVLQLLGYLAKWYFQKVLSKSRFH